MENKTEDVVLDEEGVGRWLQHKVLHEGLWRILQLSSLACELILSGTRWVNFQCSVHLVSVHGSLIMLGQMIIRSGESSNEVLSTFHLISLELAHHVDQDAAVEHRVAVDRGHVVSDFLLERSVKDGLAILVLAVLFATMNESTSGRLCNALMVS